jgi:hypothetical protein
MANQDVAVPIVFPDYLITVETPPVQLTVPDLLPRVNILPDRIKISSTKQKVSYLGHAGILFIEGSTGLTKYYEYGRYDPAAKGLVRNQAIADVTLGKSGKPLKSSLAKVLAEISKKSGQGGKIRGAYIELAPGAFRNMLTFAVNRMKTNTDPRRAPYELLSNSCLHFMKEVAEAGGVRMPPVFAPQPIGYILEVRLLEKELDFEPGGRFSVEDMQLD